ncbi:methyltransferase domain-containing protein [Azoarcus communis]|uniref:class I SAM-dependent methyltransferase n=1 Tax=Parazoarcus communis TaxID=41977 RepID=UPI0014598E72|nr:class I SAM-dependent methyltransferase [Parazoarcus communis]NMG50929.1 methyltransferase domain-containing protein [Parazoarcus communis]
MPSARLLLNLVLDLCAMHQQARVPEPTMSMSDSEAAAAFMHAGREDGILAHTYLYHAIQASAVIPRNSLVVDLGCGPANQLASLARLNPDCRFVGVDASPAMLDLGRQTLARAGLPNVTLVAGDMTSLSDFADTSADAVISTMSLHHLPDTNALHRCLAETRRILKPGGGLYLADFGRLKREASQRFFAHEREAEQPSLFTLDYYNSLRAAFSTSEIRQAASVFDEGVRLHKTFLVPFLLALRSRPLAPPGAVTRFAAQAIYNALDARQQYDFRDLARFFGHGGFPLAFKPW